MASLLKNYVERILEQVPKVDNKIQSTYVNVVLSVFGIHDTVSKSMTADKAVAEIMRLIHENNATVNQQAFYVINKGQPLTRQCLDEISNKNDLDLDTDLIFRSASGKQINYDRYMQLM